MMSDDTEHTCLVAQALIAGGADVAAFRRALAWRLRYWLLGLPAGVGFATLRAILRLWIGFSAQRSGVYSAGNGPAMRAAVIGATIDDPVLLRELTRAATRLTHSDPKAEFAALAIALAAQLARRGGPVPGEEYLERLRAMLKPEGSELLGLLGDAAASAAAGQSTLTFADSLGLAAGVSGYAYHSVPVTIHAWLRHQGDFRAAVGSVIACGGDTDTTAAMVGGIAGAAMGRDGIPAEWLQRLWEWPRSVGWMQRLGAQLARGVLDARPQRPIGVPVAGLLARNLLFLLVVLGHGFRRLLPPY